MTRPNIDTNSKAGSVWRSDDCVPGFDVVPNQMYKDQPVDWWINSMGVHHNDVTLAGRMPMEELSIDGNLNNWEETIEADKRLHHW